MTGKNGVWPGYRTFSSSVSWAFSVYFVAAAVCYILFYFILLVFFCWYVWKVENRVPCVCVCLIKNFKHVLYWQRKSHLFNLQTSFTLRNLIKKVATQLDFTTGMNWVYKCIWLYMVATIYMEVLWPPAKMEAMGQRKHEQKRTLSKKFKSKKLKFAKWLTSRKTLRYRKFLLKERIYQWKCYKGIMQLGLGKALVNWNRKYL